MKNTIKYSLYAVACLAAAGAGSSARAAISTSNGGSAPLARNGSGTQRGESWVMGNVVAATGHRLAINTENGRMRTLKLGTGTKIIVNGKRATTRDLEPGALVMASYEGSGAHATALHVGVDEASPDRAAAPATDY